jgi:uncharacterized Zn finger protein
MTEHPDPQSDAIVKITRFLLRKGAQLACPFCGQEQWGLIGRPGETTVMPMTTAGQHYPLYTLVCMNCGFVRSHVASVVDDATRETIDNVAAAPVDAIDHKELDTL